MTALSTLTREAEDPVAPRPARNGATGHVAEA